LESNGFATAGAAVDRQAGLRGNQNTGSSNSHNHSFTGSSHNHTQNSHNHTQNAHNHSFTGTAINLAVSYVDLIIATKD
jgi:hypothetical protein